MRTVKSLIEELQKFPDDALCHAYQGEVGGIAISKDVGLSYKSEIGFVHCAEGCNKDKKTEFTKEFQKWKRRV